MSGHSQWNGLPPPGHLPLFPSLVLGTCNLGALAAGGWVATIFSRGALGCFALKVRYGWHLSICSLTCAAIQGQKKQLHIRSSIHSRPRWPISLWHPLRVVSLCIAGRTSWNRASWDSFGRIFLHRMSHLSLRWLHLQRNCWSSGGLVSLSLHWPRLPSYSLAITRPKAGSTSQAWCLSSMVMQVTCRPSPTGSRTCRSQLYAWGWPGHPQQGICIDISLSCPII